MKKSEDFLNPRFFLRIILRIRCKAKNPITINIILTLIFRNLATLNVIAKF